MRNKLHIKYWEDFKYKNEQILLVGVEEEFQTDEYLHTVSDKFRPKPVVLVDRQRQQTNPKKYLFKNDKDLEDAINLYCYNNFPPVGHKIIE